LFWLSDWLEIFSAKPEQHGHLLAKAFFQIIIIWLVDHLEQDCQPRSAQLASAAALDEKMYTAAVASLSLPLIFQGECN